MPEAPLENARKVTWQINSRSQGNKRLRRLEKYDVDDEGETTATNEIGSESPTGVTRKPGGFPIEFDFRQTQGTKPDCDWEELERTGEFFSLTRQIVGGRRTQFLKVSVSQYTEQGDKDGEYTYNVKLIALEKKKLR